MAKDYNIHMFLKTLYARIMTDAITVSGLHKRFGPTTALDGLDLQVREGEVHGFLGPNGAGKSTTLRVLLGLIRASGGAASVLGRDPWTDSTELHRSLAYVPGDVVLWPSLTGGEVIDLMGRLRGGLDPNRRSELVERFDLDERKRSSTYSKGNRQKVALIAALASDVPLYLLDEPTSGLDPLMERVFRDELARLRADGRTVLLSSHILSEVEATCQSVTIVRLGRAVESGTLEHLRQRTRSTVRAGLATPPSAEEAAAWPGVADVSVEDGTLACTVDAAHLPDLLSRLNGLGIRTLVCTPPSLEDLFLQRYASDATAEPVSTP